MRATVEPINRCVFRRKGQYGHQCANAATSKVTYHGAYPHQVCEKHVSWAKQRVIEIENS